MTNFPSRSIKDVSNSNSPFGHWLWCCCAWFHIIMDFTLYSHHKKYHVATDLFQIQVLTKDKQRKSPLFL